MGLGVFRLGFEVGFTCWCVLVDVCLSVVCLLDRCWGGFVVAGGSWRALGFAVARGLI